MTVRICCECKKEMGVVEDGRTDRVPSHGICLSCMRKNHPGPYPMFRDKEIEKNINYIDPTTGIDDLNRFFFNLGRK